MSKRLKQRLAYVLTLSLVLGLITVTAPAEKEKVARAAGPDWSTATVLTPDENGIVFIDEAGPKTYKLGADCKFIRIEGREGIKATLDLNGHNVINDGSLDGQGYPGCAIYISGYNNDPSALDLYDTGNKAVITGKGLNGQIGLGGGGIYVDRYSKVTMNGGTVKDCVLDNVSRCHGAGVYVDSNGSEFHLNGGKIINNKIQNATEEARGIGIYAEDGSKLSISGGEISGNNPGTATAGTVEAQVRGAGIYSAADTFSMTGGTVSANGTQGNVLGGGIYLESELALSGGTVTGNGQSGIYVSNGSVGLTGTADVFGQANDAPDIEGNIRGDSGFYHAPPAPSNRSGYEFVLHEGTKTGTVVTSDFKGNAAKSIVGKKLWIEWKKSATPTVSPAATSGSAATAVPSATSGAAASATPKPGTTATPSALPSGSPKPVMTLAPGTSSAPAPSDSPTSSYKPGEGKDSEEYTKLTDDEKKVADDIVTVYPNMDYYTAAQVVEYIKVHNIDPSTVLVTDETISNIENDKDPAGSSFGDLRLRIDKRWKNALRLKWEKIGKDIADTYVLYGNYCNRPKKGKIYKPQYLSAFDRSDSSAKYTGLKKGTYYKYIMRAFKEFNGINVTVAVSVCVHGTTKGNKKNTVAKAVRIYQKTKTGKTPIKGHKLTATAGKTIQLTYKETPEEKGKTIRPHRPVLFESGDTSIVTVGKRNGKLKAKGKGKAVIFAYAQNGIYDTIIVTVK